MITSIAGFKNSYYLFILAGLVLLFTTFFVPQNASAQAFVPVKDQELIDEFKAFNNALIGSLGGGTYIDPSTGSPVAIAAEVCSTTTERKWSNKTKFKFTSSSTVPLGTYKKGWKFKDFDGDGTFEWKLVSFYQYDDVWFRRDNNPLNSPENPGDPTYFATATNPYFFLPNKDELTDAVINDSTSINCLLQELVEWEKLQINMQMHNMVKEYFTDAQTYMLSKQLLTTLAAATIEWSNKELEQTYFVDGVETKTKSSIYPSDINQEVKRVGSKYLYGLEDEIRGGAVAGKDLGLNPADQDYIAQTVVKNLKPGIESGLAEFSTLKKTVEYTGDLPAGSSADQAYVHAMENSPLFISGTLEGSGGQQMSQASDNWSAQYQAYGGYSSYLDCGTDPFCRTPRIETPGNMLGQNLYQASQVGISALEQSDELAEFPGTSTQQLSYDLQNQTLRNYNVQNLLNNQQTLAELFNEFEFVLTDYYGLDEGTTNWSRNMLVNTWDDIMWGGDVSTKAIELAETLDKIKKDVKDDMTTP